MPLISVTMPAYNTRESYLRAAIESILRQSFAELRVYHRERQPGKSVRVRGGGFVS